MKHVIRIQLWWIRVPLLILLLVPFLLEWTWDHIRARQPLDWSWPLQVWAAAVAGEFVPPPR